jgi:hypothetical protein
MEFGGRLTIRKKLLSATPARRFVALNSRKAYFCFGYFPDEIENPASGIYRLPDTFTFVLPQLLT